MKKRQKNKKKGLGNQYCPFFVKTSRPKAGGRVHKNTAHAVFRCSGCQVAAVQILFRIQVFALQHLGCHGFEFQWSKIVFSDVRLALPGHVRAQGRGVAGRRLATLLQKKPAYARVWRFNRPFVLKVQTGEFRGSGLQVV